MSWRIIESTPIVGPMASGHDGRRGDEDGKGSTPDVHSPVQCRGGAGPRVPVVEVAPDLMPSGTFLLRFILLDRVGFSPFLVFLEGGLAGFVLRKSGVYPTGCHIAVRAKNVESVILKRLPAEFHTDRQGIIASAGFDRDLR